MCVVSRMRITRAYTITPQVKRILDTKPNKSDFVCRAVRKLHFLEDEFDLRDVPTKQLLVALQTRYDQFDPQYNLIQTILSMK